MGASLRGPLAPRLLETPRSDLRKLQNSGKLCSLPTLWRMSAWTTFGGFSAGCFLSGFSLGHFWFSLLFRARLPLQGTGGDFRVLEGSKVKGHSHISYTPLMKAARSHFYSGRWLPWGWWARVFPAGWKKTLPSR